MGEKLPHHGRKSKRGVGASTLPTSKRPEPVPCSCSSCLALGILKELRVTDSPFQLSEEEPPTRELNTFTHPGVTKPVKPIGIRRTRYQEGMRAEIRTTH